LYGQLWQGTPSTEDAFDRATGRHRTVLPSPQTPESKRMRTTALLFILLVSTLTACGGSDPDRRSRAQDDAASSPLQIPVDTLFRVGSVEGGTWDSFFRIQSLAFGPDGSLYILDAPQHRIHRVAPDGTHLGSFGRQGSGPGEFQTPLGMAVLPSGDLVVLDLGNNGFQIRAADGTWLRDVPLDPTQGILTSALHAFGDQGVAGVAATMIRMVPGEAMASNVAPSTVPIRRWNLDDGLGSSGVTERATTLVEAWRPAPPPSANGPAISIGQGQGGGARTVQIGGGLLPMAFAPGVHMAVLADGRLAVADTSSYRIRIYPADVVEGDANPAEIQRPIAPRPVGPAEQEAERARRLAELDSGVGASFQIRVQGGGSGGGGGPDVEAIQAQLLASMREQMASLHFWHEIPVITGLRADAEGRLWVSRSGGVGTPAGITPGPVDVLLPDGMLLGTVPAGQLRTPDAFGPGGLAAWIERDELDVPFVHVARIRLP
jgi:hypothetical protein